MTLADMQWSYNGLTFGEGTIFYVNKVSGFEGFDTRTSDSDLPYGDGAIRGADYVAARLVSFELAIIETDDIDGSIYEGLYAAVRAAFAPSRSVDLPLTFKRPGQPERVVMCRPIQLGRSEAYTSYNRVGFPPVVLRAADPRIYASTNSSVIVPVYSSEIGGFELPADFPLDFSGGSRIEAVAVNNGSAPAYPTVRFYAPEPVDETVPYPSDDIFPSESIFPNDPPYLGGSVGTVAGSIDSVTLTNTTTGDVLAVATSVPSGQVLTADMTAAVTAAPRPVISVDGISRYGAWALPRAAFALAPGPNTLRFEVTGTATNARCHLEWADTWIS